MNKLTYDELMVEIVNLLTWNNNLENYNKYCKKFVEIIEDETYGYIVNYKQDLLIKNKNLTKFPFKFGRIDGNFNCSNNQLESLEGAPDEVKFGFYCQNNKLKNLDFLPKNIGTSLEISLNQLESLEGCPKNLNGSLVASRNKLKNLKGCPETIKGSLKLHHNQLESLDYFPKSVGHNIELNNNNIKIVKNLPNKVKEHLYLQNNPIEVIENFPSFVEGILNLENIGTPEIKNFSKNLKGKAILSAINFYNIVDSFGMNFVYELASLQLDNEDFIFKDKNDPSFNYKQESLNHLKTKVLNRKIEKSMLKNTLNQSLNKI